MKATEPSRPWWRKRRWQAALTLWLACCYFLAYGAGAYSVGRGWIPPGNHFAYQVFAPIGCAAHLLGLEQQNADYVGWWLWKGDEHRSPGVPCFLDRPCMGAKP